MSEYLNQDADELLLTAEYINSLPIIKFTGPIYIIDSPRELNEALDILSKEKYIGFDTESRPSFKKGQNYPISLLQLATLKEAYIVRLGKTGITGELAEFFQSNIEKVGVGLKDDLRKLYCEKDFTANAMVDLSEIARKKGHQKSSLRALSARYLQHRVVKSAQKTNWARTNLTEMQLKYAATDAWACLLIRPFLIEE